MESEYTLEKSQLAVIVERYGLLLNIESGAYEAPFAAFAAWYYLLDEESQKLDCDSLVSDFDIDLKLYAKELEDGEDYKQAKGKEK